MDITEAAASDDTDAGKQPEKTERNSETSGRKYVNVLLDLSEEDYSSVNNMPLVQSRTGWEDAVEGWGRLSPFTVFLQPPRKGKNKTDITTSHCLLCADLKLSDLPMYCPAENSLKTFKKTTPTCLNLENDPHNTISPASSDELYSFSLTLQNMPGPLINKLLSGDEHCTQKKTLCHYHRDPCQILKEKSVAVSIRSFSVLPPVKGSRNQLKEEGVTKVTMPSDTTAVTADERMSVHVETGNVIKNLTVFIPEDNRYRFKESPSTKYGPSQDNTQLPPTFNITFQNKYQLPSSTVANILPQFSYPLGRNLRQDESTNPAARNNASYRLHSAHKARDLKRPEATNRLMLIGTRVHMPM